MSKDRARLLDILDWARAAMKEAAGRTRADFDTDENFFLAQVKRMEVVGEAASPTFSRVLDSEAFCPFGVDG